MGIFGSQSIRLLREKWGSTQQLAEELFAMFQADTPIEIDGSPLTIIQRGEQPPVRIVMQDPAGTPIQIFRPNPDTGIALDTFDPAAGPDPGVSPPGVPPPPGGGGGGGSGPPLQEIEWPNPGSPSDIPAVGAAPFVLLGSVRSGSGQTYQVDVYGLAPPAGRMGTVTATAPNIDAAETVPPDSWVFVLCFPGLNSSSRLTVTSAVILPPSFSGA